MLQVEPVLLEEAPGHFALPLPEVRADIAAAEDTASRSAIEEVTVVRPRPASRRSTDARPPT